MLCAAGGGCAPDEVPEGLRVNAGETSVEGTFGRGGSFVRFSGSSDEAELAALHLDVNGRPLDITLDLARQDLVEDAHGRTFRFQDREILLALRDAVAEERPEVMQTLHGSLLVRAADRFAEVPIGPALARREVRIDPEGKADTVTGGCGGDGVTCLSGTSGTSWAVFSAGGVCRAERASYGDNFCRGRCGYGCNWFDNDYTWDCLDHDVCLDYSSDCNDEFNDAADDWAATVAPYCFSGSSRSKPPSLPVCGNHVVEIGEQCDDGGTVTGDGCSATCFRETPGGPSQPVLAGLTPEVVFVYYGDDPTTFTVSLDAPAVNDTTVALAVENPNFASLVDGASIVVPQGAQSATFGAVGLVPGEPTHLTASLDGRQVRSGLLTITDSHISLVDLQPQNASIVVGETRTYTVTLRDPAPRPTLVELALDPGWLATLPGGDTVLVPEGATSATFEVRGLLGGTESLMAAVHWAVFTNVTVRAAP